MPSTDGRTSASEQMRECCTDPRILPLPRRGLARRLSNLLDEVVFSVEHGIPFSVVDELALLGQSLESLDLCARTVELKNFRQAVDALINVEPDAVDRLLNTGKRLVASLEAIEE